MSISTEEVSIALDGLVKKSEENKRESGRSRKQKLQGATVDRRMDKLTRGMKRTWAQTAGLARNLRKEE